jgi:hypothetical protein
MSGKSPTTRSSALPNRRGVPPLIPFLVLVSMVFIGILVFAYVEAKKANPQMIDDTIVGVTGA